MELLDYVYMKIMQNFSDYAEIYYTQEHKVANPRRKPIISIYQIGKAPRLADINSNLYISRESVGIKIMTINKSEYAYIESKMKQIFIILFAISMVYANHIKWHGNYEKALKEAREQNKVLMVLLIKNNCQKCKDLVKDIFINKPYIDELNHNVISVIVNIDNKHSFPIEMYWSNEYPTLFFVNSQNEIFIHKPFNDVTQKDIQNILIKIMHNKS